MILIIDGYNLLKHIYPRVKGKLGKQRDELIRQLSFYKKKRSDGIKDIVIVFDGGQWGKATREIINGVVVVFSGQNRSADDWIVDYSERNSGREMMLVSRDRELIKLCREYNVEPFGVSDFYDLLQNALLEEVKSDLSVSSSSDFVEKYDKESANEDIDSEALDILMAQTSFHDYEKEDSFLEGHAKKGKSRMLSKKEKKLIKKIKKL